MNGIEHFKAAERLLEAFEEQRPEVVPVDLGLQVAELHIRLAKIALEWPEVTE